MSSSENNPPFHNVKCLGKTLVCPFWHLVFTQDTHGTGRKKKEKKNLSCNTEEPA